MKNVAILTTFTSADPAYSLNRVVQDQISMLVDNGYKLKVFVRQSDFWDGEDIEMYGDPNVELIQLPNVPVYNEIKMDETFEEDVMSIYRNLDEYLVGVDVVITHDIIYQPDGLKFNLACRRLADSHNSIIWLHWIHSATSPYTLHKDGVLKDEHVELLSKKWPNSYPVFFNALSIPRIATNFRYEVNEVKVVPHPTNVVKFFGLSDVIARLYKEKRFYEADIITTYPVRLDRGKQVEWVIKILARLKAQKQEVRLVVMDFHSTGGDKVVYREELKELASNWGLTENDVTFLSEFDESTKTQAPHSMVREMLSLSNLFILPSVSESYSLVAQEAGMSGNLLLLNDDFTPFLDIFGTNAIYGKFGSNIDRNTHLDGVTVVNYQEVATKQKPAEYPEAMLIRGSNGWIIPGDALYANDLALRVRYEFGNNIVLAQEQFRRKERNLYSVFKTYLEPLFYMKG